MKVAWNDEQLTTFLGNAADVSPDHPVVITKFVEGANEIELDGVANKGYIVNWAISEHIENAGVHSGDATMVFPSAIAKDIQEEVFKIGAKIAEALEISGPFNIQFLEKKGEFDGSLGVIECNLRSSRSFPFVSKCLNIDFIDTCVRVFVGEDVKRNEKCGEAHKLKHVSVKSPQFSFARLPGSDPVLGVEMGSTGEVACYGRDRYEAYLKAVLAAGFKLPKKAVLIGGDVREDFLPSIKSLITMGLEIYATPEIHELLTQGGIAFTPASLEEKNADSGFMLLRTKTVDMVINFPFFADPSDEMRFLRRHAVNFACPIITNTNLAKMTIESIEKVNGDFTYLGWDELFDEEPPPYTDQRKSRDVRDPADAADDELDFTKKTAHSQ